MKKFKILDSKEIGNLSWKFRSYKRIFKLLTLTFNFCKSKKLKTIKYRI